LKSAETQQIWKFYGGLWKLNLKFYFLCGILKDILRSWRCFWR